jgi:hypothetical protein
VPRRTVTSAENPCARLHGRVHHPVARIDRHLWRHPDPGGRAHPEPGPGAAGPLDRPTVGRAVADARTLCTRVGNLALGVAMAGGRPRPILHRRGTPDRTGPDPSTCRSGAEIPPVPEPARGHRGASQICPGSASKGTRSLRCRRTRLLPRAAAAALWRPGLSEARWVTCSRSCRVAPVHCCTGPPQDRACTFPRTRPREAARAVRCWASARCHRPAVVRACRGRPGSPPRSPYRCPEGTSAPNPWRDWGARWGQQVFPA